MEDWVPDNDFPGSALRFQGLRCATSEKVHKEDFRLQFEEDPDIMVESKGAKIMAIDDTIQTLTKIYQSIDKGIPRTASSPDALVNYLNELYAETIEGFSSEELFAYDDVGSPSITLTISIDVEFDIKRVMDNMRKRLHTTRQGKADAIGKTGIVWSYGRYDFIYDDDSGLLRISHKYGHKRKDTRSVLSIIKRMIDYAKDYIEEVKKSTEESTSTPETE